MRVLMRLSPLILLIGCSSNPQIRSIPQEIPPVLTQGCEKPELQGDTWADLVKAYQERGYAIDKCNKQLENLRRLGE